MRFWIREVAGWLLVVLGLVAFYACYDLLKTNHIVEAGPLTVIGIFIFRGGIHLLKVAVAARICQEVSKQNRAKPPTAAARQSPSRRVVLTQRVP